MQSLAFYYGLKYQGENIAKPYSSTPKESVHKVSVS